MFASPVLVVVFCLAVLIALLLALALFSPIVVTFDSSDGQIRLNWLAFVECLLPLPGKDGEVRLSVGGRPASFVSRKPAVSPPETADKISGREAGRDRKRKPVHGRTSAARFLRRCLADSVIRRSLAKQLARLWRGFWRSLVLTRIHSRLSLPDPAFNGMLLGALAQAGSRLNSRFSVNFIDENSLFLEMRVYPHRLVKTVFLFLTGLPYLSFFRVWRASSS
jgi:hypothetical protein